MEHAVDTGRPKVVIIWEANLHCALSIDKMEGWGSIWTNYWRSKIKISWKSLGIPENIMENMKYQVSLIQDKAHSIKSRGWGTQEDCFSVVSLSQLFVWLSLNLWSQWLSRPHPRWPLLPTTQPIHAWQMEWGRIWHSLSNVKTHWIVAFICSSIQEKHICSFKLIKIEKEKNI